MHIFHRPKSLFTAAVLSIWTLGASSTTMQSSPVVTPPSRDFISPGGATGVYHSSDNLLHMSVLYFPQDPQIYLISIHTELAGARKMQSIIKTSFWPTCVRPISNGVVLVAGKNRRTGATVIEVWTLSPPTLSAASTPSTPPTLNPGSIADINPVYSGNEAGKLLVRKAMPHRGVPGGAIIQFDDSRDLYALNTVTAAMTPIASPDATRAASLGCFHAPILSQKLAAGSGELVQGGYVYEFRVQGLPSGTPSTVHFLDSDKNGTIDELRTLSAQQWTAAGYANSSAWVQHDF
jgi:hypothetical protein